MPFAAYTTAATPNAFQWAGSTTPKIVPSRGGSLPGAVAPGADPVRWSGAGIRLRGLANISCPKVILCLSHNGVPMQNSSIPSASNNGSLNSR